MKLEQLFENELPMDDASRMQRAKELGFTIAAYHGTDMQFDEFDLEKGKPAVLSGYAPHFASKKAEANGYAKKRKAAGSKTAHVLHVLLRIKKPFNFSYNSPVTKEEYISIVGTEPLSVHDLCGGRVIQNAKDEIENRLGLHKPFTGYYYSNVNGGPDWEKHMKASAARWESVGGKKRIWTELYKRLKELGYDALIDPETGGDHSKGFYKKIVVLDPKNVRSINARFDPAKSESRNLMD